MLSNEKSIYICIVEDDIKVFIVFVEQIMKYDLFKKDFPEYQMFSLTKNYRLLKLSLMFVTD